jgi:hypothetical protein
MHVYMSALDMSACGRRGRQSCSMKMKWSAQQSNKLTHVHVQDNRNPELGWYHPSSLDSDYSKYRLAARMELMKSHLCSTLGGEFLLSRAARRNFRAEKRLLVASSKLAFRSFHII